jgi:hypothetical protein
LYDPLSVPCLPIWQESLPDLVGGLNLCGMSTSEWNVIASGESRNRFAAHMQGVNEDFDHPVAQPAAGASR